MRKLFVLLIIFCSTTVWSGEPDNRQTVQLTAEQRNFVLTEMRSLLAGLEQILTAMSKDDMPAVAVSARALGFTMKHKAENPLHEVLPRNFMQMGMAMHRDFDKIADDAAAKQDSKLSLKQLGETLNKCNACHMMYQIQTSTSP